MDDATRGVMGVGGLSQLWGDLAASCCLRNTELKEIPELPRMTLTHL